MPDIASNILSEGVHAFPFIGGAIAVGGGSFKSVINVPQEHVGLRTHFGKAKRPKDSLLPWGGRKDGLYGMVGPGLRVTVPFTHSIKSISLQDRTSPLDPFMVDSEKGRQHQINSSVTWGVIKERDEQGNVIDYGLDYKELVYRAIYNAKDEEGLITAVTGVCVNGLRQAMLSTQELRAADPKTVQQDLIDVCGDELLHGYGVEVRRLNLSDTAYSAPDILSHNGITTSGVLGAAAIGQLGGVIPMRGGKAVGL